MFVVLFRYSAHEADAPQHTPGHEAWIADGLDAGVFLVIGSTRPGPGGAILAVAPSAAELHARLAQDPFVAHDVVTAEVIEITPHLTDPRLAFLAA